MLVSEASGATPQPAVFGGLPESIEALGPASVDDAPPEAGTTLEPAAAASL
jgi:hypothetical protein